jgi:hypothetical protein
MLIEIDESYQEPETPNEKIMHAICWDGKNVAETAALCEVTEDQVLDVVAKEFKFTLNRLRNACANLRQVNGYEDYMRS